MRISIASGSESDWIKDLQRAKRDTEGLSTVQLLRRDYKEWDLGAKGGMWGVSSVTASLDYLMNMPDWSDGSKSHPSSRKLSVFLIMVRRLSADIPNLRQNMERKNFISTFWIRARKLSRKSSSILQRTT